MYMVMRLHKEIEVNLSGFVPPLNKEVKLSWADGMIGVCPAFDSYEDAEKYTADMPDVQILEIEYAK